VITEARWLKKNGRRRESDVGAARALNLAVSMSWASNLPPYRRTAADQFTLPEIVLRWRISPAV
jgi:hypothetical protein